MITSIPSRKDLTTEMQRGQKGQVRETRKLSGVINQLQQIYSMPHELFLLYCILEFN